MERGAGAPLASPPMSVVVTALGFTTLLGYGSSYYLPAILAVPISTDTGWSLSWGGERPDHRPAYRSGCGPGNWARGWPLSAYLVATLGWRPTCFIYAALHVLVALPMHAWLLPATPRNRIIEKASPEHATVVSTASGSPQFLLVAAAFTLAAAITSIVSVHLLTMLQSRGHTIAAAVAIGTLLGPGQIIGRGVELAWGGKLHPIGSALISAVLMGAGVAALTLDLGAATLAVAIYAAGAGVSFVIRGTLPLALFGPRDYGTLIGRLGLPSQIAQALAPWVATILLSRAGTDTLLWTLVAMSVVHVATIAALMASPHTLDHPDKRLVG